MESQIFRNYDIRGIYPNEIDEKGAYIIVYFFGEKCKGKEIIIGFDGRLSAKQIFNSLSEGIIDAGAKVFSLGLVPTSLVYFADKVKIPAAAIMITASHNPKEYIGFKMILDGESFCGKKIEELKNYVINSTIDYPARNDGEISYLDLTGDYLKAIFNGIRIGSNLKIGWDLCNGAASSIFDKFLLNMPNENLVFNKEIDGNFPSHPPDPTEHKNIEDFAQQIRENNCDLGIAFDGDGDRVVFITQNGDILFGDQILLIFAKEILKENPNSIIISEVKSSNVLFEEIERLGGKAIMSKTGHSNIKSSMKAENAILAGELSCHFFFKDSYFGYDDGFYAALRMIDIVTKSKKTLQEIYDELPKLPASPEIKINVPEEEKFKLISLIAQDLHNMNRDFIDIDGVRYSSSNGWWLVRASNTSPAICIRMEGRSEKALIEIEEDLRYILAKYNLSF